MRPFLGQAVERNLAAGVPLTRAALEEAMCEVLTRRLAIEERERADVAITQGLPEHHGMWRATLESLMEVGELAKLRN